MDAYTFDFEFWTGLMAFAVFVWLIAFAFSERNDSVFDAFKRRQR